MLPVALVVLVALTLWSASREHTLIVEALSVPKRLVDAGFTGQVIASKIVDRMDYMTLKGHRELGNTRHEVEPPDTPLKVQVESGGISVQNIYSYARSLVGHDVRVSAEIVDLGDQINLSARRNDHRIECDEIASPKTVMKLVNDTAECILEEIEPDRYARYLVVRSSCSDCTDDRRKQEIVDREVAWADYRKGTSPAFDLEDRAWAWEGLGVLERTTGEELEKTPTGDYAFGRATVDYVRAKEYFERALNTMKVFPLASAHLVDITMKIQEAAVKAGDDETQLSALVSLTSKLQIRNSIDVPDPARQAADFIEFEGDRSELLGAYGDGIQFKRQILRLATASDHKQSMREDIVEDESYSHDVSALRATEMALPDVMIKVYGALEKWPLIIKLCEKVPATCREGDDSISILALAYSNSGGSSGYTRALDLLRSTSPVCDFCLRAKAIVYSNGKAWGEAETAFSAAIKHAPDMPIAYEQQARYLLKKAKSERQLARSSADDIRRAWSSAQKAVSLGPHFADGYEVEGEILVLQDRSDLALEMFRQADRFAPRWKELHYRWAEALHYVKRDADAAVQKSEADSLQ